MFHLSYCFISIQVYSNDNSRAPSGQSSPLKKFAEKGLAESAAIDDSRDESTAVSIKHTLDHEELGNKVRLVPYNFKALLT